MFTIKNFICNLCSGFGPLSSFCLCAYMLLLLVHYLKFKKTILIHPEPPTYPRSWYKQTQQIFIENLQHAKYCVNDTYVLTCNLLTNVFIRHILHYLYRWWETQPVKGNQDLALSLSVANNLAVGGAAW